MRWFKHTISLLMVVAAAVIGLVTFLSDHSADYGRVPLPQGGVVQLPKGKVTVFYSQVGDGSDPIRQLSAPLNFQAVPVGGGQPVPVISDGGVAPGTAVQRSETIGELGSIAKLDVPKAGAYVVSGSTDLPPGTSFLKLGTNPATAVLDKWKLLAGLVLGAFLISIIPVPRAPRRWEDEKDAPTGWSSDSRAPYAG